VNDLNLLKDGQGITGYACSVNSPMGIEKKEGNLLGICDQTACALLEKISAVRMLDIHAAKSGSQAFADQVVEETVFAAPDWQFEERMDAKGRSALAAAGLDEDRAAGSACQALHDFSAQRVPVETMKQESVARAYGRLNGICAVHRRIFERAALNPGQDARSFVSTGFVLEPGRKR